MFELDFQKSFKNIEISEIFEFFQAHLPVASPLPHFPGLPPGKNLEKLKYLKNLNVFKAFLKSQLKNLKKKNLMFRKLSEVRGTENLIKHWVFWNVWIGLSKKL